MGKIILVTGGARSGKSSFAEELFGKEESVLYIATAVNSDPEMSDRIARHQAGRNPGWTLLENYNNFDKYAGFAREHACKNIILDCVTNMVSNLMLDIEKDWENVAIEKVIEIEKKIASEFDKLLMLNSRPIDKFVLVTNELGMGLVPAYPLGRHFRDIAGRINQKLAACADEVYFLVSGIPCKIKGNL